MYVHLYYYKVFAYSSHYAIFKSETILTIHRSTLFALLGAEVWMFPSCNIKKSYKPRTWTRRAAIPYAEDMHTSSTAIVSNPKTIQLESTKRLFQTPRHQTTPLKINMIKLGIFTDSPSSRPAYDGEEGNCRLDRIEAWMLKQ